MRAAEAPSNPIIADLAAADQARSAEAAERQQWAIERERANALAAAITTDIARHETALERLRAAGAEAEAWKRESAARHHRLAQITDAVRAIDASLRECLQAWARRLPPGAVQQPEPGAGDVVESLERALVAFETGEKAAAAVSVELIEGKLDGQPRAVKMLRAGGAAWWADLEGKNAGIVEIADGDVRLIPADGAPEIRQAIAIAEHRRPPHVIALPIKIPAATP